MAKASKHCQGYRCIPASTATPAVRFAYTVVINGRFSRVIRDPRDPLLKLPAGLKIPSLLPLPTTGTGLGAWRFGITNSRLQTDIKSTKREEITLGILLKG